MTELMRTTVRTAAGDVVITLDFDYHTETYTYRATYKSRTGETYSAQHMMSARMMGVSLDGLWDETKLQLLRSLSRGMCREIA